MIKSLLMSEKILLSLTGHSLQGLLHEKLGNRTLYRLKIPDRIVYRCVATENEISEHLLSDFNSNLDLPTVEFGVKFLDSGQIEFQLSDRGLAVWLQQLPSWKLPSQSPVDLNNNFFPLQYTHSRCCSLLRLGHQEGLIQLKNLDFQEWSWLQPQPIPWLQSFHARDYDLIYQFFNLVEATPQTPPEYWFKLATRLSESMLDHHRYVRIWGEVQRETPKLAQARLGLIAITQNFLRILLVQKFQTLALIEL